MRIAALLALVAAYGMSATAAYAADAGISGTKLIVVDRVAVSGQAKAVFVSKDPAVPGSVEGHGAVEIRYAGAGSVLGAFLLPTASAWLTTPFGVSKYVNPDAPAGGGVKVAVFKEGKVAKISAKALGDAPFLVDLFAGGTPSAAAGIRVTISFPEPFGITDRYCSQFASDQGSTVLFKEIANGAGRKLVARDGVAATCDPQLCASHSPFDDGAQGPLGECGGLCPPGLTCVATLFEGDDVRPCECVDPGAACGDALFPTCLGSCPVGEQCNTAFLGTCGCGPVGTRCEFLDDAPTCGGVCATGQTCQPSQFDPSLCECS